ncbi:MAG: hypothetical protein ACYCQJ_13985 [Nitrososphaerales archaeon]
MALDLNFILLVVELVLLAPTLLLLILGRREEKGRRELLTHITSTARLVQRQDYFNSVRMGMEASKEFINGSITGSMPKAQEQEDQVNKIIDEIKRASRRNVSVKYILPKLHDRLTIARRYREAGAEIRFHPGLVVSDVRYVVIDGKNTVLGLPSGVGEDQPTREGYLIPSEGLAHLFLAQFEEKWAHSLTYDEFVNEIISEARSHNPSVSDRLLSTQLQLPEEEVRRIQSSGAPH